MSLRTELVPYILSALFYFRILLDQSSHRSVNASCSNGFTPLHIAVFVNDLSTVHQLVLYGADPLLENHLIPSPFQLCTDMKRYLLLEYFLQLSSFLVQASGWMRKWISRPKPLDPDGMLTILSVKRWPKKPYQSETNSKPFVLVTPRRHRRFVCIFCIQNDRFQRLNYKINHSKKLAT